MISINFKFQVPPNVENNNFLHSLESFYSLDFLCRQILAEDFKISLTSLSCSLLGYRLFLLFLLSRYPKVKVCRFFTTVSHPPITAGHEGKPLGKREYVFLLLTSLLLYFYSEHLVSSITIYSALQLVLFVELLSHINEISGILQIVGKF